MTLTWNVDPTFAVNGVSFRYYSFLFMLAGMAGYGLLYWQLRRARADVEEAGDYFAFGSMALLVGARLGHVLFYDIQHALIEPAWILRIWEGGLASHGGVTGLALAMWIFCKRRGIAFWEGTDRLVMSVAFGSILFRLGNLLNSEIVGRPTQAAWGMRFPRYELGTEVPLRHPSQLYEMALGAAVFVLLVLLDRHWGREARPRGALTGAFLLSYGVGRVGLEFFKEDEVFGGSSVLTMGQLLTLPGVVLGAWLLWSSLRRRERAGWQASD